MRDKYIVREAKGSYQPMNDYLCKEHGFINIDLLDQKERPIQSKKDWLRQGIAASKKLFGLRKRLKDADTVILVGNYMSLFALLLNKLGIIRPKNLVWWGLFIHSQKAQKTLGRFIRMFNKDNVKIVVFAGYEADLYSKVFRIPKEKFMYIPYGDWNDDGLEEDPGRGDYYFAGGYTNRDYENLLAAWEHIPQKLVIIGSENNADLMSYLSGSQNPNVKVLLDTEREEFDVYLRGAKACIQPFKEDTGACGQTVALRCMRIRKVMICSDIAAMREYIDDGKTGILIDNMRLDLPAAIERLEKSDISKMEEAQTRLFKERFSKESLLRRLDEMFGKGAENK